jgi:hypothetical protein
MRLRAIENLFIVLTMLTLNSCITLSFADEHIGHCLANEEIYFSCLMKNGKTLSLCGSANELSYKYGKPGQLELVFPSNTEHSMDHFSYNNFSRYGVDYFRVSFTNEPYQYTIYRDIDNELNPKSQAGIIIKNKSPTDEKEYNLSCSFNASDNLNKLPPLLKCDKENALGCAN